MLTGMSLETKQGIRSNRFQAVVGCKKLTKIAFDLGLTKHKVNLKEAVDFADRQGFVAIDHHEV